MTPFMEASSVSTTCPLKESSMTFEPVTLAFRFSGLSSATILGYVDRRVMARWMRTGIQQALNAVVFKLLKMNMIYPVADEHRFSDNHGNVLPHAYLLPDNSTPLDLAGEVHSRLVEQYILALDAKTGLRLPKDYRLRHRDIIKIMTQTRAKKS